ncbi:serpin-Z2B-like [Beta vulgaris subsp. vulgaris]|uniref:serpin-Z2B-like n=1 Tax=Beta vulgaris subsp. vulgaris TaxID=3555 RepID=UPI002036CB9D|nr:serpin-Z2B-like [Beta vulgaris subsp. vulgaris]
MHRGYAVISQDSHLMMNFSLKVANSILQNSLAATKDDDHKNKNVVCSPISIDNVVNILVLGTKGPTLKQLLELVGCNTVDEVNATAAVLAGVLKEANGDDAPEVCFTNTLWVDQHFPLNASFREVLRNEHKTEAWAVDFKNQEEVQQVINEVNLWAEAESKGLIKQIVSKNAVTNETMMLLINALYFKGTWVDRFKPENTKDGDFYLLNGTKVETLFMNNNYKSFDYGTFEGCQVLRMLYNEEIVPKGEKPRSFSMYIFLPEAKNGLIDLLEYLNTNTNTNTNIFKDKIKLKCENIDKLSIPKFDLECNLKLSETMKGLGMTLPFDEYSMDLTGFIDFPLEGQGLYVTDIVQKCRVEIDEEGTKAVAFTEVHGLATRAPRLPLPPPPPPINFVADHPFMFMIREDFSGAILFVGTVVNPIKSSILEAT